LLLNFDFYSTFFYVLFLLFGKNDGSKAF